MTAPNDSAYLSTPTRSALSSPPCSVLDYAEEDEVWCHDRGDGISLCGEELDGEDVPPREIPDELKCPECVAIFEAQNDQVEARDQ